MDLASTRTPNVAQWAYNRSQMASCVTQAWEVGGPGDYLRSASA